MDTWLECSESCGVDGVQECSSHCRVYEKFEWEFLEEFDESCGSKQCFIPCEPKLTTETVETTSQPAGNVYV